MSVVFDILRWVIAIVSVVSTLALITWLLILFFRKDARNDDSGNRE